MNRALIFPVVVLLVAPPRLPARPIPTYTYDDLLAKSDFVVIAKPSRTTRDTAERKKLTDVNPPSRVIGVETKFETEWVIKGRKRDRFTLHHYREQPQRQPRGLEVVVVEGLLLVEFDAKNPEDYLLFLVREADGRFAPAGGQTDVDRVSIWKLGPVAR